MTYAELIDIARKYLNDTIDPYLWSDDELLVYLYKSLDTFLKETEVLQDDFELVVESGVSEVELPDTIIRVLSPTCDYKDLEKKSPEYLFNLQSQARTGMPAIYAYRKGGLLLYPIPDTEVTIRGRAVRTVDFDEVLDYDTFDKTIPLPSGYQPILLDGIQANAYRKHDSDIEEVNKAIKYEQLFYAQINSIKIKNKTCSEVADIITIPRGLF